MKRKILVATLLALVVGIPACSDKDDPKPKSDPDPKTGPEPEPTACAERSDTDCETEGDDGPTCLLVTLQEVVTPDGGSDCLTGETQTVCVDVESANCSGSPAEEESGWQDPDAALWLTETACGVPDHDEHTFSQELEACETTDPCVPAAGGMGGDGSQGGAGGCSAD